MSNGMLEIGELDVGCWPSEVAEVIWKLMKLSRVNIVVLTFVTQHLQFAQPITSDNSCFTSFKRLLKNGIFQSCRPSMIFPHLRFFTIEYDVEPIKRDFN